MRAHRANWQSSGVGFSRLIVFPLRVCHPSACQWARIHVFLTVNFGELAPIYGLLPAASGAGLWRSYLRAVAPREAPVGH